jgi:hypothetical protein
MMDDWISFYIVTNGKETSSTCRAGKWAVQSVAVEKEQKKSQCLLSKIGLFWK